MPTDLDLPGIRARDAEMGDLGEQYADYRYGDCAVEDRRALLQLVDRTEKLLDEWKRTKWQEPSVADIMHDVIADLERALRGS